MFCRSFFHSNDSFHIDTVYYGNLCVCKDLISQQNLSAITFQRYPVRTFTKLRSQDTLHLVDACHHCGLYVVLGIQSYSSRNHMTYGRLANAQFFKFPFILVSSSVSCTFNPNLNRILYTQFICVNLNLNTFDCSLVSFSAAILYIAQTSTFVCI